MTKKTVSKIIAAVMVVSMFLTVVFTGSVSAASATCTVKGYEYSPNVTDEYVTYEVTFSSSTAFTAGSFTVDCPSTLTFVACSYAHYGSNDSGDAPQVHVNVSGKKVLFAGFTESATNDMHDFSAITLLLRFKPTAMTAGSNWTVTVKDISITNSSEAEYTCANASGTAHVHNFNGSSSTVAGVTTTHCSVSGCSAVNTTVAANSTAGNNTLATGDKYANITFAADGDVVLNALLPKATYEAQSGTVYFTYRYSDGVNETPAEATITGTLTTIGGSQYYAFPCGRNAGIGRMARDIRGNFVVVNGSSSATKSAEWSYSVKKCLEDLMGGSDADAANYAKALWNYGYYTTEKLVADTDYFDDDLAKFTGGEKTPTGSYSLPTSKNSSYDGTDTSWKVSKVSVTTGYTPKMNFTLNKSVSSVIFKLYNDTSKSALVYSKEIEVNGTTFTITDIPAKYLKGEIEITTSGSDRVFNYSIGRYAKARDGKSDGNIFKWMVYYSYYLSKAFD